MLRHRGRFGHVEHAMPDRRRGDRANEVDETTTASRLAELVSELTGSPADTALTAVQAMADHQGRDALEVVAAAMVDLEDLSAVEEAALADDTDAPDGTSPD